RRSPPTSSLRGSRGLSRPSLVLGLAEKRSNGTSAGSSATSLIPPPKVNSPNLILRVTGAPPGAPFLCAAPLARRCVYEPADLTAQKPHRFEIASGLSFKPPARLPRFR